MQVRNPNFVSPVVALVAARKADLATYMANHAASEWVDFADLRAALPAAERPAYTDGVIAAALQELGYVVRL